MKTVLISDVSSQGWAKYNFNGTKKSALRQSNKFMQMCNWNNSFFFFQKQHFSEILKMCRFNRTLRTKRRYHDTSDVFCLFPKGEKNIVLLNSPEIVGTISWQFVFEYAFFSSFFYKKMHLLEVYLPCSSLKRSAFWIENVDVSIGKIKCYISIVRLLTLPEQKLQRTIFYSMPENEMGVSQVLLYLLRRISGEVLEFLEGAYSCRVIQF